MKQRKFELIYTPITTTPNVYTNIMLIDARVKNSAVFMSSANSTTFPIIYSCMSSKTDLLAVLTQFKTIERICVVCYASTTSLFLDATPFFNVDETNGYSQNIAFIISVIQQYNTYHTKQTNR
jgi:hypothetical protein